MAHSKAYMLAEMNIMGIEIMSLLTQEEMKIRENHLEVPDGSDELRADFIRPAYHWIAEIYHSEYAKARRIRGLLTDELWKRYKSWGGFDEHREVILLRKACSNLRDVLVSQKRPDFYKKTKYDKAKAEFSKTQSNSRVNAEVSGDSRRTNGDC